MISYDDISELACLMLHVDYNQLLDNGYDESYIDDMFYEEYNITLEDFEHIVKDLVKFTPTWKSPLTDEIYQGFVVNERENFWRVVIKEKFND